MIIRRRIYIVNRIFQGRFFASYYLVVIMAMAGVAVFLALAIDRTVEQHLYSSHIAIKTSGELLSSLLMRVSASLALIVVLSTSVLSIAIFSSLNRKFLFVQQGIGRIGCLGAQEMERSSEIAGFSDLSNLLEDTHCKYAQEAQWMKAMAQRLRQGIEAADKERLGALRHEMEQFRGASFVFSHPEQIGASGPREV